MKAKLWWLTGFPAGNAWITIPLQGERAGEVRSLERGDLRRATYAVTKLTGEFPRALPTIVGDAAAWEASVRAVLEALKPWVHRGEQPPEDLFARPGFHSEATRRDAARLRTEHPALGELIAALSWVLATTPRAARSQLRWIADEADGLQVALARMPAADRVRFAIQSAHLAVELGTGLLAPLVRIAGAPALYEHPLTGGRHFAARAISAVKSSAGKALGLPSSRTRPSLPALLPRCAAWLIAQDRKTQRRFLRFLSLIDLPRVLDLWAAWWPAILERADRAARTQRAPGDPVAKGAALKRHYTALRALRDRLPPALHVEAVIGAVRALSQPACAAWFTAAYRALAAIELEPYPTLRASLLVHWHGHVKSGAEPRRMAALLRGFGRHVSRTGADLSPWIPTALAHGERGRYSHSIDDQILAPGSPVADIDRLFAAFSRYGELETSTPLLEVADCITTLARLCRDPTLTAELAAQMVRAGRHSSWHSRPALTAALRASENDRRQFVALLATFSRLEQEAQLPPEAVQVSFSRAFADRMPLGSLLLASTDHAGLERCARRVALLSALNQPLVFREAAGATDRSWIRRYPAAFHPALDQLASATPRAEEIAARCARGVIRDDGALRQERDALRRRVSTASGETSVRLNRRLENIEARLREPPPELSATRRSRLEAAIDRATARALLSGVTSHTEMALRPALGELLGSDPVPEWVMAEENLAVLVPALALAPPSRRLALRLLRRRCGPPPWDLRDDPANAAFITALASRGIDPGPWLDGIAEARHQTQPGAVVLALEDDPLEIFRMGAHFGTCLSPGDFNFFSVFANAADINKRILYARNHKGTVVGRRLIGLTRDGEIVAFNAYSHDAELEFDRLSVDFIIRLSELMGTRLHARGHIPRLVAPDWYDDGPVDVGRQFAFLEEGSAFRKSLGELAPAELIAALRREIDDAGLERFALPLLLNLPELERRPELMAALVPLIDPATLPAESCLHVALALERIDEALPAPFAPRLADHIRGFHRRYGWGGPFADYAFVARHAPSIALRLLRDTRETGVRSWHQETTAERLAAAAIAMASLHRRRQARTLFQLASRAEGPKEIKRDAARRAEELAS